jgi:hypothetical protein
MPCYPCTVRTPHRIEYKCTDIAVKKHKLPVRPVGSNRIQSPGIRKVLVFTVPRPLYVKYSKTDVRTPSSIKVFSGKSDNGSVFNDRFIDYIVFIYFLSPWELYHLYADISEQSSQSQNQKGTFDAKREKSGK